MNNLAKVGIVRTIDYEEFSEYFGLNQEEDEDVETIGGLVQKLLCRLAKINDEVEIENLKLRVIELKDRRIKKVLVEKIIEEENIEK